VPKFDNVFGMVLCDIDHTCYGSSRSVIRVQPEGVGDSVLYLTGTRFGGCACRNVDNIRVVV
jgi:hypothetical protein